MLPFIVYPLVLTEPVLRTPVTVIDSPVVMFAVAGVRLNVAEPPLGTAALLENNCR
jgi:hypothetical protein